MDCLWAGWDPANKDGPTHCRCSHCRECPMKLGPMPPVPDVAPDLGPAPEAPIVPHRQRREGGGESLLRYPLAGQRINL